MSHVMIDLETLGTTPDSTIIAIGAVYFNPLEVLSQKPCEFFYTNVDWDQGRRICPSTVRWWLKQSKEAQQALMSEGIPLKKALENLAEWLPSYCTVWGNGSTFDISMLEDAYAHKAPWRYTCVRDVRTVVELAEDIVDRPPMMSGVAHNALDDAIHQAKYVTEMCMALRNGR